jgi:hypothetical protein
MKTEKGRGFRPGVQCKSLTLRLWSLPQWGSRLKLQPLPQESLSNGVARTFQSHLSRRFRGTRFWHFLPCNFNAITTCSI